MTTDDMMEYIDLSLSQMGRRIIGEQRQCIELILKANPQPVFAQLVRFGLSVQTTNHLEFVVSTVKLLIVGTANPTYSESERLPLCFEFWSNVVRVVKGVDLE